MWLKKNPPRQHEPFHRWADGREVGLSLFSPHRKAPDSNRPAYTLGSQEKIPFCCSWPRKPDKPVPDAGNSSARPELLKIISYGKLTKLSQETRGREERNIVGCSQLYQKVSDTLDKDNSIIVLSSFEVKRIKPECFPAGERDPMPAENTKG